MDLRVPPLVLLLAASPLAGCAGGDAGPAPAALDAPEEGAADGALPDGRRAIAFEETNRTEEGEGGLDHAHDYWAGREQVVLVEADASLGPFPLFPGGEGSTQTRSQAKVRIPPPGLVYEGASEVVVLVDRPRLAGAADAPSPAPAPLALRYRTAADADFRDAGRIVVGEPMTIPVAPRETDMPHSVASLWAFQLVSDRAEQATYRVTVTALRGAEVAEWPGHPDVWGDQSERVVLDARATLSEASAADSFLYGDAPAFARPERIIGPGTAWLDVWINVTSVEASPTEQPSGFHLIYHNATADDDGPASEAEDREGGRAFSDPTYHFVVNVTEDGMDGPYQDRSRWGFRLAAWVTSGVVSCRGCFEYRVEYDIRVIAHRAAPAA